MAIAGLAAGLTGSARAMPLRQDTHPTKPLLRGGFVGGGTVLVSGGVADFSAFGEILPWPGVKVPDGHVVWVDPTWHGTGLRLESIAIAAYGPVPGPQKTRQLNGRMQVNGAGSEPFVLRVVDGGSPGRGKDSVDLRVGAAAGNATSDATTTAGFSYAVAGRLTGGHIDVLGPQLPPAPNFCPATPTP
jgi:hypothetical protein